MADRPAPGDPVPTFAMDADDGSRVSNEGLRGRRYVLYFYPEDFTSGCTTQACSLRDNFGRVTGLGVDVFGVSPDSVSSHAKFREEYDLPYRLLADTGHGVADAFGVWVQKTKGERTYMGTERTTFVVGPDGRIEHVLPQVKAAEHVDRLVEVLSG